MKLAAAALGIVVASVLAPTPASSYSTASQPYVATSVKLFPVYAATTTVTVDDDSVVTITSEALRHPREVEYSAILPAGTHTIAIRCTSTRLPHDWRVNLDGVLAASASLKCE